MTARAGIFPIAHRRVHMATWFAGATVSLALTLLTYNRWGTAVIVINVASAAVALA